MCSGLVLFCFSTMQRVGLGTRLYMCHWNRLTQDTDWPLCPDLCVWHSLSQAQAEKLLIEGQSAIERMCAWLYVRVFPTHFIGTFLLLILYVATASVSLLPSLHLSLPSTSLSLLTPILLLRSTSLFSCWTEGRCSPNWVGDRTRMSDAVPGGRDSVSERTEWTGNTEGERA